MGGGERQGRGCLDLTHTYFRLKHTHAHTEKQAEVSETQPAAAASVLGFNQIETVNLQVVLKCPAHVNRHPRGAFPRCFSGAPGGVHKSCREGTEGTDLGAQLEGACGQPLPPCARAAFRASRRTPDFEKDLLFLVLWVLLLPQSSSGRAELAPSPAVNYYWKGSRCP